MEVRAKKQKIEDKRVERRLLGNIFDLFREYNLQRLQSMQEDLTEEEEMQRQRRLKIMKDISEED